MKLLKKLFDKKIKTERYMIVSSKIKSKFRIGLVSDVHSENHGENQCELIDAVTSGEPDILLLAGDICDKRFPKENTECFLSSLKRKYPTFMIMGNHDYDFSDSDYVETLMKSNEITVLNAESRTINIKGNEINICGLQDIKGMKGEHKKWYTLLDSLDTISSNGNFTVFMSHRPEKIKKYLNRGFDMIVCGHAHGGQWIVPGLINGLYAPGQGFFPKYAGGRYDFENSTMIVCRGLAQQTTVIPRILNPSEIVFIDIVPQ